MRTLEEEDGASARFHRPRCQLAVGRHFDGYDVPASTGYTIGYHIISDYREHHPHVGWPALTSAIATTILAGSDYQPCPG